MRTPRTPEEISTEWLNEAFVEGKVIPSATVTGFNVEDIGEGAGFTATVVRVNLTFDREETDLPASCIVKLPSIDPAVREQAISADLFGRENTFYSHYGSDKPGSPPQHYYSIADSDNDDFILVMEDLGHARFVTQLEGTNAEDALAVVRTLGKINAHHCENETLRSMSWLPVFPVLAEQFVSSYAEGTPLLLQNFGDFVPLEFQKAMDAGTAAHLPISRFLMNGPNSLVHGDARIENIAFDGHSGQGAVRIFDWAGALRGPAVYDLTYFIAGSLDTDLRRSIESELLDAYHSELLEGGVQNYSMEDLKEDMRVCSTLFFGFMSYVGKLVPPDEAGRGVMQSIIPPMIELMRDYDALETLKRF
jgi:hypothetical protein